MANALSDDELATFRKQCADIEELGWATVPDTVYRLLATIDAQAARLAAAEKVVEAARDVREFAVVWSPLTPGDIRELTDAIDAYDALAAPPTDRGAEK